MSYQPPKETNITFTDTRAKVEKPEKKPVTFEFDPNRSEKERLALIASDGNSDPQGGLVKFWSHSSLQQFQDCPYRLYLRRVKRLKEPSGEAAERGSLIHDECEAFVRGERTEIPQGKKTEEFRVRFETLQDLFQKGQVHLEENWGFDVDWNPIEDDGALYKNSKLWCMTKLDVFVREDEQSARVIDHKTGRKYGNEVKHGGQAMEYAVSAFMRYPEIEHITTEFWYLDQGQESVRTYNRQEAMLLLPRINERAIKMTSATKFPAKPSEKACKWCHFRKSGDCEYGEAIG